MCDQSIEERVLKLWDEDPKEIINWILGNGHARELFMKAFYKQNKGRLDQWSSQLVERLNLSRQKIKMELKPLFEELENVLDMKLLKTPSTLFTEIQERGARLRKEAGMG